MSLRCSSPVHSQRHGNSSSSFRRRTRNRQALRQRASPSRRHHTNQRGASPIRDDASHHTSRPAASPIRGPSHHTSRRDASPIRDGANHHTSRRDARPIHRQGRRQRHRTSRRDASLRHPNSVRRPNKRAEHSTIKACAGPQSHKPRSQSHRDNRWHRRGTAAAAETTTVNKGEGAFALASDLIMTRARDSRRGGVC